PAMVYPVRRTTTAGARRPRPGVGALAGRWSRSARALVHLTGEGLRSAKALVHLTGEVSAVPLGRSSTSPVSGTSALPERPASDEAGALVLAARHDPLQPMAEPAPPAQEATFSARFFITASPC